MPARRLLALIAALAALALPAAAGAAPPQGFSTVTLASGFTQPTGFALAPDGRIFVIEKAGVVKVVQNGNTSVYWNLTSEVDTTNDRGLLGIALSPNFATDKRVFLLFTQDMSGNDNASATAGGKLISVTQKASNPNQADPATRATLLQCGAGSTFGQGNCFGSFGGSHSIGTLRFDSGGRLLVGFGDGSSYSFVDERALLTYDFNSLNGKIIRIDPNTGNGVGGNPYYEPMNPSSVRSKVIARGFRNPFRFTYDQPTSTLWVGDVGWNTWEELDAVPTSTGNPDHDLNFGWPCYEGTGAAPTPQPGYQNDPSTAAACDAVYTPAEGGTGIGSAKPSYSYNHSTDSAVVGGPRYRGSAYPASYTGTVFLADYARDRIQVHTPGGGTTDFGTGGWGAPVDLQARAGNGNVVYAAIATGQIKEIVYTGTNHAPIAKASASPVGGPVSLNWAFSSAGSGDPDPGDTVSYLWTFGDGGTSTAPNPNHAYAAPGTRTATLKVTDNHGALANDSVTVTPGNSPPTVSFLSPTDGAEYRVGQTLGIQVAATDAQDGALAPDKVSWQVILHHLNHLHYEAIRTLDQATSYAVPDHGDDFFLELRATATDSLGATATTAITLSPRRAPVTVTSEPAGATLYVDGVERTAPYTWGSIVGGGPHYLVAPTTAVIGGESYRLLGWTDGTTATEGQTRSFTTPDGPLAFTARYVRDGSAPPVGPADAHPLVGAGGASGPITPAQVARPTPRGTLAPLKIRIGPRRAELRFAVKRAGGFAVKAKVGKRMVARCAKRVKAGARVTCRFPVPRWAVGRKVTIEATLTSGGRRLETLRLSRRAH